MTLRGMTSHNPSSARAELIVIAILLDTIPINTKVTIFIDSQAAILAINNYQNPVKRKYRKTYKNPNLLLVIDELIKGKNINLTMNKIKAHSGIKLHDIVDELAKQGCKLQNPTIINLQKITSTKFHTARNEHLIDVPINSYTHEQIRINHLAQWKTQFRYLSTINK